MAVINSNFDEPLAKPPKPAKMTILHSETVPDPDLQVTPVKKSILKKGHCLKSHSNVRFSLKSPPMNSEIIPDGLSLSSEPFLNYNTSSKDTETFAQNINSSKLILRKIRVLQQTDVDISEELQRQLHLGKKKIINEKAASKVDYKADSTLYPNLISLDVPPVSRIRKYKRPVFKRKVPNHPPPDLMEFSKANTHREAGNFLLRGVRLPRVKVTRSPPLATFSLYQHNKVWDGLLINS